MKKSASKQRKKYSALIERLSACPDFEIMAEPTPGSTEQVFFIYVDSTVKGWLNYAPFWLRGNSLMIGWHNRHASVFGGVDDPDLEKKIAKNIKDNDAAPWQVID